MHIYADILHFIDGKSRFFEVKCIVVHVGSDIRQTGISVTKTVDRVGLIKGETDGSRLGLWEEGKKK